ncbi:DUF6783 domain-containing protein [Anaerobutyricum hallii]|uniref:DUF6783 domain-containing protein n=1 Tax=Anaerobutyricum hallii TaxID=39488 RepID=UPI003565A244
MKAKYTANWGVQIAGIIFQTRSSNPAATPLSGVSLTTQTRSYSIIVPVFSR